MIDKEKEVRNIRKRKSYNLMAKTLRQLEDPNTSKIVILNMIYREARQNWKVFNYESLDQLIKDYKDGKANGAGNGV